MTEELEELEELVIEEPTEEMIRDLATTLGERDADVRSVHLVAEESTLMEIIVECVDKSIKLIGSSDQSIKPQSKSFTAPSTVAQEDREVLRIGNGSGPRTDGGGSGVAASNPVSRGHPLASGSIDDRQICRLLELAFESHLEREPQADCAHIEIRMSDSVSVGQYRYLNNGSGRGGAHYLRDLSPQMKTRASWLASCNGLTVLSEGSSSLSVSFEKPSTAADVRFVEQILVEVFGGSISDIAGITEVVDRDTTRDWLS